MTYGTDGVVGSSGFCAMRETGISTSLPNMAKLGVMFETECTDIR